jgi:hypothetical protein
MLTISKIALSVLTFAALILGSPPPPPRGQNQAQSVGHEPNEMKHTNPMGNVWGKKKVKLTIPLKSFDFSTNFILLERCQSKL